MENGESSCLRFPYGDEQAFDRVMKEHFDHIVFFIDGYVHDTFAAEDLAIDVFADFALKKNYDGRASVKTFLFILARSKALNYLKRRKSRGEEPLEGAGELEDDRAALEDEILKDERSRALAAAMSALPPDMRQAVHLVYFEDLSYEQTAKVMKKNKKQVDNLLFRAKNALRAALGEEGRDYL